MKRIIVLLLFLSFVSLGCLQTAMLAESVPAEVAPTATATEIESGAVYEIPSPSPRPVVKLCALVVAVQSLHLRSKPNFNSEPLSFMWSGEEVQLLDNSNSEWWKVRRGGVTGYARSKYLAVVECE